MWTYSQSTGKLFHNGSFVSGGYSGKGRGKNNPSLQGVVGTGPLPRGHWRITEVYNSKRVGPFALVLHANDTTPSNDTHDETGRGAFRIHGDSVKHPGNASNGCIILPRVIREEIWRSGDRDLIVTE